MCQEMLQAGDTAEIRTNEHPRLDELFSETDMVITHRISKPSFGVFAGNERFREGGGGDNFEEGVRTDLTEKMTLE